MLNSASAGITSLAILIGTHVAFAQPIACPEQPRNEPLEKGDPLRRTLVITEPAILNRDTFSLARTLDAIIQSGRKVEGANPPVAEAERIALLQSVIDSFGTTEVENPDSHIRITVDERPAEHALKPTKLLNQSDDDFMRPVALFNRFDLAPRGFEYCGEHRIVYAKGGRGSFFLIFEAALSLPETKKKLNVSEREAVCRSVAKFWDSLKSETSPDIIRSRLEEFYYRGLDVDQDGNADFPPVVHRKHFGLPFGQLRGNLRVELPWQLREWILTPSEKKPSFTMATVKNNPVAELYGANGPGDNLGTLKDKFKSSFVDNAGPGTLTYLEQLTSFDRELIDGSVTRPDELSAVLGMSVWNGFNHFQSNSDSEDNSDSDDPGERADGDIRQRITAKLAPLAECKITSEHILNRAGAVSCGGCHQFSGGKKLAPGVVWPHSAEFVHVTETGVLSPALKEEFLPARRRILEKAISGAVAKADSATRQSIVEIEGLVGEIESLVLQLREDQGGSIQSFDVYKNLQAKILAARERDLGLPGAFVPIRRVH